jgi:mxaL protein
VKLDVQRACLGGAAIALAASLLDPPMMLERKLFAYVVVLDVTQSMNVADVSIEGRPASRLALAKHALRAALPDLPCGSKLGWAVFTEHRSYLLLEPVEVCANRVELRGVLERIDGRMAWSGNSEVAKGLHSAISMVKALPGVPSLVFVTDGHEAPPLTPNQRPAFDDKPGEVAGLLVGVGEPLHASPIPKLDPLGRPLGLWGADDVLQVHPRGRGASVAGEGMVESDAAPADAGASLGATPGREHLSSLREPYLQLLAAEGRFSYHRLQRVDGLAAALRAPALARPLQAPAHARVALLALALLLLLAPYVMRLRALVYRRRFVPEPWPTKLPLA